MVPLRFIAESFRVKVDWDGPNRTAVVGEGYTPPKAPPAPVAPAGGAVSVSN